MSHEAASFTDGFTQVSPTPLVSKVTVSNAKHSVTSLLYWIYFVYYFKLLLLCKLFWFSFIVTWESKKAIRQLRLNPVLKERFKITGMCSSYQEKRQRLFMLSEEAVQRWSKVWKAMVELKWFFCFCALPVIKRDVNEEPTCKVVG